MDTYSLYGTVRKVLKNKPLEDAELHIFENWQSGAPDEGLIFERTAPEKKQQGRAFLKQAVSEVQSSEQLYSLFEKLFTPVTKGKLPVVEFSEEDNPANLETSTGVVAAHYELRELDDLIPSHDPLRQFAARPDYFDALQDRPYHLYEGEKENVRRNAASLNPRYLINTSPDAMTGPPCISRKGIVLGGNSRTMSMQLAYEAYPEKAEKYKETLSPMAFSFGFTKQQVESMKKPVLVRVVNKRMGKDEVLQASRYCNQVSARHLQLDAEGISKSKLVSQRTMRMLLTSVQEFGTLESYLRNWQSLTLIDSLADDGVIENNQLSSITDDDALLNSEGKELVKAVLRGLIVQDYDLIRVTPACIVDKIDRAIPALVHLKVRGGEWDISDLVTRSLKQIQRAINAGYDVDDINLYFATIPLVTDPDHDDKGVQVLAATLAKAMPDELATRLNVFAADAAAETGGAGLLLPTLALDAEKSFAKAFLRPVASICGKTIGDFCPEKNEKHAAILWALQESGWFTIKEAIRKLDAILTSPDASKEDKENAKKNIGHLLPFYECFVSVYMPVVSTDFSYSPENGDHLLKR